MKTITKLLTAAATAAALSMTAASAQAALWIGYSLDGGATITDLVSGDADGVYDYLFTNLGGFEEVAVSGDTGVFPGLLHASSVDANSAGNTGGAITLFVSHTDILANTGINYKYQYANTTQNGGVTTVGFSTFLDDSNSAYGGVLLASGSHPFPAGEQLAVGPAMSGPFSVTHRFDITMSGRGSTAHSAAVTAIPEPATWGLMIMGFGGAGAMLRRRRTAVAA